jgi:hypothetical protein
MGLGISSLLASVSQEEKVITTEEYLSYLNSIAPSDIDHLYELKMGEGVNPILRLGTPGEYYYLAPLEQKKKSLLLVSLVMSQFYCDWENREAFAFSNEVTIEQDPISEREKSNLIEDSQALLPYPRSTHYDPLLSSNIIINVISSLKETLSAPQSEEKYWDLWEKRGAFFMVIVALGGASYSCFSSKREKENRGEKENRDNSIPYKSNDRQVIIITAPLLEIKSFIEDQSNASDSEDEEMLHVFKNQLFSRQMYLDREDIDDQDLFNESSANIRVLENLLSPEIHHKFFNGVVDSRTIQEIQDLMASHQKIIEWTEDISIDDLSINQQIRNLKKLTDSTKKLLDTKMGIQIDSIKAVDASCVSDVMGHAVQKTTREIFYQRYYDLLLQKHDHALTNFNHWQKLCYFCHEHQILPIEKLHQLVERANANSALCDKIVKNLEALSFNHEEIQEQDRFLAQETDEIDDLWKKASLAHSIKLVASSYGSDAIDRAVKTVKRESFNHSYWDPLEERYDKAHSNYGFFKKLYILCKEHQILPTQELHSLGESANANSARCAQIVRNLEEFSFNQKELQEHDHFLAQQNEKISEIIDKTKKKTVSSKIMTELEKITKTLSGWKPLSKFSPIKNYLEHRLMSCDSERTSLETSIDDYSDISN